MPPNKLMQGNKGKLDNWAAEIPIIGKVRSLLFAGNVAISGGLWGVLLTHALAIKVQEVQPYRAR
jgi:hypothetical protein